MSNPAFWADVVVGVHLAYVAVIVVGLLLILIGAVLGWQWVRNFWFRLIHLAMMLYVAGEALLGVTCPLTTLERRLREQAGQTSPESFTGWLFHNVLFIRGLEPWMFAYLHVGFGLLVLATFVFARPRWPFRTRSTSVENR